MLKRVTLTYLLLYSIGIFSREIIAQTDKPQQDNYNWFISAQANKYTQPVSKLSDSSMDTFIMGCSFFTIPWVAAPSVTSARDGLGPLFNANTCTSCHVNNLSSPVLNSRGQPTRALVFKLSQPERHAHIKTHEMLVPDPVYGMQIAINGTQTVAFEATPKVEIKKHIVTYLDGQQTVLREFFPTLENLNYGQLAEKTHISLRQAPTLLGLGLVSQLTEKQILDNADVEDLNEDGISGKPNRVFDPVTRQIKLGRFGHKASQVSVVAQSADAAANDMGLTNPHFPNELCTSSQAACKDAPRGRNTAFGDLDLPRHRLNSIAFFINHLKAPKTVFSDLDKNALLGRQLFKQLSCSSCHISSFTTPSGTTFHPYSDFLLHDMGEKLADHRPEFLATANEWRTAPLWGVGAKTRLELQFLHDGRAQSVEEAILWHGGEAESAKNEFMALEHAERLALLSFLEAL